MFTITKYMYTSLLEVCIKGIHVSDLKEQSN